MKKILISFFLILGFAVGMQAQELREEAFGFINTDYPGLEKVKAACEGQDFRKAACELLDYYRSRTTITHPDLNLNSLTISETEQKWADDAMEHTFFVHKGYQPSYNYGKDINWQYWPIKDNELRWQLHRHKWFTPMGKAYRISGDEKYAAEWAYQYLDWIRKNPLKEVEKEEFELVSAGEVGENADNVRFAWRPLEVSNRIQDQTLQFMLFNPAKAFTPEFLTEFIVNYQRHCNYLIHNYSEEGNHLLFEAQRMIYAGVFFPEFKDAPQWRESGIDILNREIKKQVYADGGHFELDPHYHLATINIFCKALRMADCNGFRSEFPQEYLDTIKGMIEFYANICFPDYTNPCFSDAKLGDYAAEVGNYRDWLALYPDCEWIRYYATEGREGRTLPYLSHASLASGFFTFRNGWGKEANVMVVKAGPKAGWHCQPDNGTFELWFNGKNLFPDSGTYVYAGDDEVMKLRNWFRQTRVHNTLTLDGKNIGQTESSTLLWQGEGDTQVLVTENPSYEGLKHRRTVFFVDRQYYVIVDEAVGDANGMVNLNYHFAEGKVEFDTGNYSALSDYDGDSNVLLRCFPQKGTVMEVEDGWRSIAYRQREPRKSVSFNTSKTSGAPVRYITVIYPITDATAAPKLKARFISRKYDADSIEVKVTVNGKTRKLKADIERKAN